MQCSDIWYEFEVKFSQENKAEVILTYWANFSIYFTKVTLKPPRIQPDGGGPLLWRDICSKWYMYFNFLKITVHPNLAYRQCFVTSYNSLHFNLWVESRWQNLGHFWSKLVFRLLLWNDDSCFIQTWHKYCTSWLTFVNHFILWFDPIWLKFGSFLFKIDIFTSILIAIPFKLGTKTIFSNLHICLSNFFIIWANVTEFWVIFGQIGILTSTLKQFQLFYSNIACRQHLITYMFMAIKSKQNTCKLPFKVWDVCWYTGTITLS